MPLTRALFTFNTWGKEKQSSPMLCPMHKSSWPTQNWFLILRLFGLFWCVCVCILFCWEDCCLLFVGSLYYWILFVLSFIFVVYGFVLFWRKRKNVFKVVEPMHHHTEKIMQVLFPYFFLKCHLMICCPNLWR